MGSKTFKQVLLKTAFCCMACDGDIDDKEVDYLKSLYKDNEPQITDADTRINDFVKDINTEGKGFLKKYISELSQLDLCKDEELEVVRISLKMIYSDDIIKYSELKFFKLIRSQLKVGNDEILEKFNSKMEFVNTDNPDIIDSLQDVDQFLEEDIINESYVDRITRQYFDTIEIPVFDITKIEDPKG